MNCLLLVPMLLLGADPSAADRFSDVRIEKPFDRYLLANPLLMESTGAKVIKLPKKTVAGAGGRLHRAEGQLRAESGCAPRKCAG